MHTTCHQLKGEKIMKKINKVEDLVGTYIKRSDTKLFAAWWDIVQDIALRDDRNISWFINEYCSVESRVRGVLVNSIGTSFLADKTELFLSDFMEEAEEPSFEVGQQVTISNVKGYTLGEFGEQFLGEICTVRSLFESSNANEGSIEMVVVSLEDGTCGCFRSDTVEVKVPNLTWQEEVSCFLANSNPTGSVFSCDSWMIKDVLKEEEVFLEMCRVALRSKGEIG